jgi:hypothetical protein
MKRIVETALTVLLLGLLASGGAVLAAEPADEGAGADAGRSLEDIMKRGVGDPQALNEARPPAGIPRGRRQTAERSQRTDQRIRPRGHLPAALRFRGAVARAGVGARWPPGSEPPEAAKRRNGNEGTHSQP